MLRNVFFVSLLAVGITACGGGSDRAARKAIYESCIEGGIADAQRCDCVTDQMVEALDPEMLEFIVAAKESEDEAAYMATEMSKFDREDMEQFERAVMRSATECDVEMEGPVPQN